MHGILGMAELGTCKSKASCDSILLLADLLPAHAQVFRDSKVDC
jgi:hypothetical protein